MVLFYGNSTLVYQVFIEAKGGHLALQDQWKEDFLKSIKDNYNVSNLYENAEYKLIGLPFYTYNKHSNTDNRDRFSKALKQHL